MNVECSRCGDVVTIIVVYESERLQIKCYRCENCGNVEKIE